MTRTRTAASIILAATLAATLAVNASAAPAHHTAKSAVQSTDNTVTRIEEVKVDSAAAALRSGYSSSLPGDDQVAGTTVAHVKKAVVDALKSGVFSPLQRNGWNGSKDTKAAGSVNAATIHSDKFAIGLDKLDGTTSKTSAYYLPSSPTVGLPQSSWTLIHVPVFNVAVMTGHVCKVYAFPVGA